MLPILYVAFFVGSAVAHNYLGLIGAAVFFVLFMFLRNAFVRAFLAAGPRTSRQVPPQPIALCQQLSAQQLSECYQRGEMSCYHVVSTYIDHIKRVNPYINAMVYDRFDEALEDAKAADKIWTDWRNHGRAAGKPMPSWLTGVPCTIKECMQVIGCPNTSGHPMRTGWLSDVDSPVVHNFREAGAIILGVTNTSELCMWYESSNYNYGITCNPFDTRTLVGGSSGGEGAAAGAAFSTFSLGSDIGGSIRMPAFFHGVFGHKASPHYLSNRGQHPGAKTSANHYMATGPITRFADDLIPLSLIAARGGFQQDPIEYPQSTPFSAAYTTADSFFLQRKKKPLRIFAIEDFNLLWPIRVSQSQIDAVHAAAEALREHYGAEVTYINVRDQRRCTGGVVPKEFRGFAKILSMWAHVLTKDPTETKFHVLMSEGHNPPHVNWFAEVGRWLMGRSRHTLPAIALSVIEQLEILLPSWMTVSKGGLVVPFKQGLEELLGDDGVLIAPTFPTAAQRHHYPLWNAFQFQYTAAFNVLQLPATALPVWPGEEMKGRPRAYSTFEVARVNGEGTIDESPDRRAREMRPRTGKHDRLPDDFHLPKGVQIVGATNQDELCVSIAAALSNILGGYRYPGWARLEGVDY